jgi:hypothetical protein
VPLGCMAASLASAGADPGGFFPLVLASACGFVDVVRLLLQRAGPGHPWLQAALQEAQQHGDAEVVQVLQQALDDQLPPTQPAAGHVA